MTQKYTVAQEDHREKLPYLKKKIPANSQYFPVPANRYFYVVLFEGQQIDTSTPLENSIESPYQRYGKIF